MMNKRCNSYFGTSIPVHFNAFGRISVTLYRKFFFRVKWMNEIPFRSLSQSVLELHAVSLLQRILGLWGCSTAWHGTNEPWNNRNIFQSSRLKDKGRQINREAWEQRKERIENEREVDRLERQTNWLRGWRLFLTNSFNT